MSDYEDKPNVLIIDYLSFNKHQVASRDGGIGVLKQSGKIAVVSEQKESLRVEIQATLKQIYQFS